MPYEKSKVLSEYFIFLTSEFLFEFGFQLGSPLDPAQRGSHISLKHPEAYRISQALIHPKNDEIKIIPDFREPDNIRFGLTPLYTTFAEIWKTTNRLKMIMETNEYELFGSERNIVT
jgi:kynureninase